MERNRNLRSICLCSLMALASTFVNAEEQKKVSKEIVELLGKNLNEMVRNEAQVGRIRIDSSRVTKDSVRIYASDNLYDAPIRENFIQDFYNNVRNQLPADWKKKKIGLFTAGIAVEKLVPHIMRGKDDKKWKRFATPKKTVPIVKNTSATFEPKEGLKGRHIAMWQSHGCYYEAKLDRWEWQRARIFQTVEDLYTQSYVLPFLVPMLENAGAYVLMPRERDANPFEVIIDNDSRQIAANAEENDAAYRSQFTSTYCEHHGDRSWANGKETGFAFKRPAYINHENPFKEGTYRQVETIKKGNASTAVWQPDIPQDGEYAVYVSYHTLAESTDDAKYTVFHNGQETTFSVNQQMGGGTWIYLGTFYFKEGKNAENRIELSKLSSKSGRIVTADAVKVGGGMGNVARYIDREKEDHNLCITLDEAQKSGYPRFCEGARYWMQWAGVPDSIYDLSKSCNDYTDDYKNRGLWVNWLAGGSASNPTEKGLNIPIDLSFAFHSDAGTTLNNNIIGTLAIYDSEQYDGIFPGGASRTLSRDLTDIVQSSIVNDIRALCEPKWTRRQMWDKPYFEAWMPKVPAMLLELLSHQNFADMRYGLDPRFRFIVSRAIYKGILKFIATQRNEKYAVQPLPVSHMTLELSNGNTARLTWRAAVDSLEPTANAEKFIVYTRIEGNDWDNGQEVKEPVYEAALQPDKIYSYKVVAINEGGQSFPSEILSAGIAANSTEKPVLVINNFNRISAPADFVAPEPADTALAGFLDNVDHGVPYIKDISYIGSMKEFRRRIPWMDDDAAGFGDSYADYEKEVIAGNTFDYPYIHGAAILNAGRSFVSCSDESVKDSLVRLEDYAITDLILGKECQTKMGRKGIHPLKYKTFDTAMQKILTRYLKSGGHLFVSGAFIGTDLWDSRVAPSLQSDKDFATQTLKYKWRVGQAAKGGKIKCVKSKLPTNTFTGEYTYHNQLNSKCYVVESPDAIEPACAEAATVMRYSENNLSAAVAYNGNDYKTIVMAVPFETIQTAKERETMMQQILNFLK